jgi:phosphoglycolate phosphatase
MGGIRLPPYKLVIFDFDGTLADSFGWFLDVFDEIADRFRFRRLDRDRIDHLRGLTTAELLRHHGVPLWKVPMIATHARTLQSRRLETITVFDGMGDVVSNLRVQGVTLALVTSNAHENVARVLGQGTMADFSHVLCGASLLGKTAKFRAVLKAAGIAPIYALAIGDELRDIEAARATSIPCGAVGWGYALPERLRREQPDHFFERPQDITDVFNRDS